MNCDGSMHPVGMMSARLFLHTHPSKSWDLMGVQYVRYWLLGPRGSATESNACRLGPICRADCGGADL